MKYIEPKNINEIMHYIRHTLSRVDEGELSITDGSSNIVGATSANSSIDIRAVYASYPELEELVDLATDIEIYNDGSISSDRALALSVAADWKKIRYLVNAITDTP